jgi:hypothetical protein
MQPIDSTVKPVAYCFRATLEFFPQFSYADISLISLASHISNQTDRKCQINTVRAASPVKIELDIQLSFADLADPNKNMQILNVVAEYSQGKITSTTRNYVIKINGDISSLEKIAFNHLILEFTGPTALTNFDKVISEQCSMIQLINANHITEDVLSLYRVIHNRPKNDFTVFCTDQIPQWVDLMQYAQNNDYSITKFQTLLLQNGLKQFARR